MRHRFISVLLCFLCAFLAGCTHAQENHTDFTHPVTKGNVVKEQDTVYHWAQPSVFEDMVPVITEKTDRTAFLRNMLYRRQGTTPLTAFPVILSSKRKIFSTVRIISRRMERRIRYARPRRAERILSRSATI